LDASPDDQALMQRLRDAASRHGVFNAYYLCNARCTFHFTNHEQIGMVAFRFEGVVLTDTDDRKCRQVDLQVELDGEVCDWLTSAAVEWLADTVRQAVKIEFDRYIDAGDLRQTIERMERLRAESEAGGGFLGMGL
jgi:hypothetical protein